MTWRPTPGEPARPTAEVTNLPLAAVRGLAQTNWTLAQWQQLFPVYAEQGSVLADVELPPMVGDYRVIAGTLRFTPRFPAEPGVRYRAVFRAARLPGVTDAPEAFLSATFQVPANSTERTTVVEQIHPATAVLPENLLKFYIQFSAPMSRGHIYDYIQLRDKTGAAVELPFLEINEELWNPAMTRLTLFLDPGRIKRGVRPLEETGPSLVVGGTYTLVIDPAWQDATGTPLRTGFERTFRVVPPDRTPPDPAAWKLTAPPVGTRQPLRVTFDEPLDHAILQRVLRIIDPAEAPVAGTGELSEEDRTWSFTPTQPWRAGEHHLHVPTAIEDLAGNNIGKPFDVDLSVPPAGTDPSTNARVILPFLVQ